MAIYGGGSGATDVDALALATGPTVAVSGAITEIETPVSGWNGVINLLDAVVGRNEAPADGCRPPRKSVSTSNLRNVLAALVSECQPVESAFAQLLLERSVDTAVGAQLDVIGRLVGQARSGQSDDIYRRYVRARIAANRSSGTINDVLRVIVLVVYDPTAYLQYVPQHPAAFVLRVERVATEDAVAVIAAEFLRDGVSVGVRAVLEYSTIAPAATLRAALSNGAVSGNGAVGISASPTTGGKIARAIMRN